MEDTISLVFIADDNYIHPTITAITSVMVNNKSKRFYSVKILVNAINEDSQKKLSSLCFTNFSLTIIDISSLVAEQNSIIIRRHVTKTALAKFFIPTLFFQLDKILYIDSDVIVQDDISQLYDIEITDYYMGVVKDTITIRNRKHLDRNKISNKFYFNSGVMLLNLNKMRNDNITQKLLEHKMSNDTIFMDQDTFNAVVGHNVLYLSYKYNFLNYYNETFSKSELSSFFGEDLNKRDSALYNACVILHFGGKEKPWIYDMKDLSRRYLKYYNMSILKKNKLKLEKRLGECKKVSLLKNFFSVTNSANKKYKTITILGIKIHLKRNKSNA